MSTLRTQARNYRKLASRIKLANGQRDKAYREALEHLREMYDTFGAKAVNAELARK